jgi:PAS domain S-box-containing protein
MFTDEDANNSRGLEKILATEMKANQDLSSFSQDTTVGIIIGDLWGYISDVNDVAVKLIGASDKSEIIGKHVLNFILKEERDHVFQESIKAIMNNENRTENCRIKSTNGEIISIQAKVILLKDKQGEKIGFIDIIKKI